MTTPREPRSLGCAPSCGRCCDPVSIPLLTWEKMRAWAALADFPDPRTARGWRDWRRVGWTDDDRPRAIDITYGPDRTTVDDARFVSAHWTPTQPDPLDALVARVMGVEPTVTAVCDVYDSEHRRCSDWENRPPICRGFPWYGVEPTGEGARAAFPHARTTVGLGTVGCSYLHDLPADQRPPNSRPLLPLHIKGTL